VVPVRSTNGVTVDYIRVESSTESTNVERRTHAGMRSAIGAEPAQAIYAEILSRLPRWGSGIGGMGCSFLGRSEFARAIGERIEPLVLVAVEDMSRENPLWGAPRIHGELLKLGFAVARSNVAKYWPGGGTIRPVRAGLRLCATLRRTLSDGCEVLCTTIPDQGFNVNWPSSLGYWLLKRLIAFEPRRRERCRSYGSANAL
jgi:hypothetical protein